MIGIAITTYNRPDIFQITLDKIKKYAPKDAVIVIVDDGSENPHPETTYHFKANSGIAVAKNKCLELLYKAGCAHLFLFDNDCYPIIKGWEKPYIESKEPHLCYTFLGKNREVRKTINGINILTAPNGCMLYFERRVLDTVGGFDTGFKFYGGEHKSFSRRIFNIGLTSHRYMDVVDSHKLIFAYDNGYTIKTTIADTAHYKKLNSKLATATWHSKEFHPFM